MVKCDFYPFLHPFLGRLWRLHWQHGYYPWIHGASPTRSRVAAITDFTNKPDSCGVYTSSEDSYIAVIVVKYLKLPYNSCAPFMIIFYVCYICIPGVFTFASRVQWSRTRGALWVRSAAHAGTPNLQASQVRSTVPSHWSKAKSNSSLWRIARKILFWKRENISFPLIYCMRM